MEAFEIRNLTFTYPGKKKKALNNVGLSISKGDFFVLCGYSGSGKTTLLRLLKPSLSPNGEVSGEIIYNGRPISELSDIEAASKIGFVMQSPESQTVTDKVWHELAFSLESIGCDSDTIRRRTAEMASFFGIGDWMYKDVSQLSGGQKQLLSLVSVMTLRPEVLILDEPTSQLDPVAASDFLSAVLRINREIGTTVILSEHRLDDVLSCADKAAVMENGEIICCGTPTELGVALKEKKSEMFCAMPAPMRAWGSVKYEEECPVTVNEGRIFLECYKQTHTLKPVPVKEIQPCGEEIISAEDVWFSYEKDSPDVIKGFNLKAYRGELFCILGSNGSGKTTALKLLCEIKKAVRGSIKRSGKIAYLPQDVKSVFLKKTVLEDLYDVLKDKKIPKAECEKLISQTASLCRITNILDCHPYDISGGEQQKAAIAKLLLLSPDILLLDEPTKALDAPYKRTLAEILINLRNSGKSIIMVSHDVEFCAKYADRCGLFFDGSLLSVSPCKEFFSGNSFYTTSAERMSRGIISDVVTVDDVVYALGGEDIVKTKPVEKIPQFQVLLPEKEDVRKLPLSRKIGAAVCALAALVVLFISSASENIRNLVSGDGVTSDGIRYLFIYGVFILALILLAVFLSQREKTDKIKADYKKQKLPERTVISSAVSLLLIPLTLFAAFYLLPSKQYYITALIVIIECTLPFVFIFEGRRPGAREIALLAVLSAIGVAGRAAFFMLPQFKPVAAIVIITGIMFGGESGFFVGAISMLVSNMFFSQGPWTPWQMFAMGLIGFVTGILSQKGILRKSKISLCVYGFMSTLIIYGTIVNASTALIWGGESLNLKILLGYYISGFPMDIIHAFSTAIFLWFGAQPLMDILERVKIKYAINM